VFRRDVEHKRPRDRFAGVQRGYVKLPVCTGGVEGVPVALLEVRAADDGVEVERGDVEPVAVARKCLRADLDCEEVAMLRR
jgi:hypothetical protein